MSAVRIICDTVGLIVGVVWGNIIFRRNRERE
jgi:hypothetical protein